MVTKMKTGIEAPFQGDDRETAGVARGTRKVWTTPRLIESELAARDTENIAGIGGDSVLSSS